MTWVQEFFHQEHRSEGIKQIALVSSSPPPPLLHPRWYCDDDDDGGDGETAATQTRCNPLFTLCSSDNHFESYKHLFKYTSVTACVGYGFKKNDERDRLWLYQIFIFIFKILYWIMYSSNNAIILPVCNIRVEICLYIIIAVPRLILFSIHSSLFLTWCSYIKYLSKLKLCKVL